MAATLKCPAVVEQLFHLVTLTLARQSKAAVGVSFTIRPNPVGGMSPESPRLSFATVEVGVMPKAIALIVGSSLAPEALSAARQAFDNAWAEIAGKFNGAAEKETARLTLATAILSVATNENCDVETLKQAGLQALARGHL